MPRLQKRRSHARDIVHRSRITRLKHPAKHLAQIDRRHTSAYTIHRACRNVGYTLGILYTGFESLDESTRRTILHESQARTHRQLTTGRTRAYMRWNTNSNIARTCDGFSTNASHPRREHWSKKDIQTQPCISTPHYRVGLPEEQPATGDYSSREQPSAGTLQIKSSIPNNTSLHSSITPVHQRALVDLTRTPDARTRSFMDKRCVNFEFNIVNSTSAYTGTTRPSLTQRQYRTSTRVTQHLPTQPYKW